MLRLILILIFILMNSNGMISHVKDGYVLIQTPDSEYIGNSSNQTYSINPSVIKAGKQITIIDKDGNNTIELVKGLSISSSVVTSDELLLNFSNGASVNIRGAENFTFSVGGNRLSNIEGEIYTFDKFVTEILKLPKVPADGEAPIYGDELEIGLSVNENKEPKAFDSNISTFIDSAVNGVFHALDENDKFLRYIIESNSSNGRVEIIENSNSFRYIPNSGFIGNDSFTYRAYDGEKYSNEATVYITVKIYLPIDDTDRF